MDWGVLVGCSGGYADTEAIIMVVVDRTLFSRSILIGSIMSC